ncbi:MAG TPA: serine acetyltransferase [Fimbriiglobus sp.]|nr:serine acetyltransferase [Fimbriiglobus sp.]
MNATPTAPAETPAAEPVHEPAPVKPARPGLWRQIYRDYRRYRAEGKGRAAALFAPGLWATGMYRATRWATRTIRFAPARKLFTVPLTVLTKVFELGTGITVPYGGEIGEGFYIENYGTIVLASRGGIGDNCTVCQGVTIGLAGRKDQREAPVIGNRVYIGPNAVLVGKLTVGDDAVICAGAVVTRSIPPRAVVLGNPARVMSHEGSFEYIRYDGMESDPDRSASLTQVKHATTG